MDLSKRVDYELLYELELCDPDTDQPLGITFKLRSAGSDAVKKILREHTNRNLERRIKGKLPKADQLEKEELEKAAACIASWDWGGHTWKGKKPDLSLKLAIEVMDEQGWIFGQVSEAANKVANFSPSQPEKPAST